MRNYFRLVFQGAGHSKNVLVHITFIFEGIFFLGISDPKMGWYVKTIYNIISHVLGIFPYIGLIYVSSNQSVPDMAIDFLRLSYVMASHGNPKWLVYFMEHSTGMDMAMDF